MTQAAIILMSTSYLILALMLILHVYIGLRTLLLGIALPAEAEQDAAVRGIRRNYAALTSSLAVVVGGACFFWMRQQPERGFLCWATAILLLVMGSGFAIRIGRMSAQRLKAARGWQVAVPTKRAASITIGRTQGSVLSAWWYSAHAAVMALCIFAAIARWDAIPQGFATFLGDHYASKSVWTVFAMNIVQAMTIALFVFIHLMIGRARMSVDPLDREGSLHKQLKRKRIYSILALGASLLIIGFHGVIQAITLYGWEENLLFYSGLSLWLALFLGMVGVMLYQRIKGLDQFRDIPSQEDRHWKWLGSIYVNPEDPALIVPDRHGFAWTINMANPRSKVIIAAAIAVLVMVNVIYINFV
ncbi:DUF5808 domain-containing protein [Paenibacillus aurantiacus]|uniref:DUF5808 domain-containing protein n=1 Tax=Paenibacillus aurantiacus TaxID=1936118 RepID=A0ABV5KI56_9BACL